MAGLLPKAEQFGLISQMQRAATSVPANIAEGHGRAYTGAYCRHLSIAQGSLLELETHLLISQRLSYLSPEQVSPLLSRTQEIGRMLHGLTRSLKASVTARSQAPGVGSQGRKTTETKKIP